MTPQDYANNHPKLVIEDYLQGKTWAWGMLQDRFGKVRNRYKVLMEGEVDYGTLHLDEVFFYDDGTQSKRLWKINILGNGQYQGTADDVIGVANGSSAGNTFNWQYSMDLPISNKTWRLNFDDWLYLQQDGMLINVATVSKWGITLGTLTFFFSKQEPLG